MTKSFRTVALTAGVALTPLVAFAEPVEFHYWYGLTGQLGRVIEETCDRFNASQDEFEIVCTGQGDYAQAFQNTIAAFRAGEHPTIVQIYDIGTASLMLSDEFYPAHELMADFGIEIDWDNYIEGISAYYASSDGDLFSFPFNSSTPMMYYNKDAYEAIGQETPPETWEEVEAVFEKLAEAGYECPAALRISSWTMLEQFSAIHDIPVASNNNGYDGLDAEFLFHETKFVDHVRDHKRWIDNGWMEIKGAETGLSARDSFAQGECMHYFGSIAGHQAVHDSAKEGLNWDVAMLPVYEGFERNNSMVGGASLWVLSGKSEEEYRGAAAYLKFLATPESERFWAANTGYMPVTKTGVENLMESGFH